MKRALLIESDAGERKRIKEILELGGYKVESAKQGTEGLRKAEIIKPDIIICRISLKGGDGFSILYSIRQDINLAEIPFIMIADTRERSDRRRAMEMGSDDFIIHPFSEPELLKSIENQIERYNLLKNKFSSKDDREIKQRYHEEPWVRVLIQNRKIQHYKEGDQIYRNGNNPAYVYYILEGQVKLFNLNEKGKELITEIVVSGEFFGYEPVMANCEYTQNSMALANSKILRISADEFQSILQGDSSLANGLLKVISSGVLEKEKDMLSLAYASVKDRIALRLVYLSKKFDSNKIQISRKDLASLSGTSMETAVRILSEYKKLGFIDEDEQSIILKDVTAFKIR